MQLCMLNLLPLSGLKFEKKYMKQAFSNKRLQNQTSCHSDHKFKYQQPLINSRSLRTISFTCYKLSDDGVSIDFIHSFIPAISIAPLQVLYPSEALPTKARILYRSFTPKHTGNCRYMTCPRSLRDGYSGSRTHDPPVE